MFDPSKLNLDLDNTKQEKNTVKSEPKANLEKINKNIKKEPIEKQDILGDLNISKNQKVTEKNIENTDILSTLDNKMPKENSEEKNKQEVTKEIWKTEYEKEIVKKEDKNNNTKNDDNKIIYDINLNSVEILLSILIEKEYDFVTFEPDEIAVKVTFRKDKLTKEVKYIKFPIYSNILLKAKALTNLTVEETEKEQEWSGEKIIKNNNYKVISKVVPSNSWPKLFIKTILIQKKLVNKTTKKTSVNQIVAFMWAISFITLIIWAAFIGFIALNAKTIEDVKFFYSLWINLNDINNFIWQALSIVFSILVFIETIFLITFLFKFSLTKKEFKQRKIRYWILSTIILIITFATASTWMIIDQKIKSLPNWQEVAYWDVQVYDNSKLLSESFNKGWSIIQDFSSLIWPAQIKFDLSFFEKKEKQKWMIIKKYIWDFWNGEIIETPTSSIIYNFEEKGNYEISLTVEEVDLQWNIIEKVVENIPNINISYIVEINEKILSSGWKIAEFDATSLKELGKVEWYFIDDLEKPVWSEYIFRMSKPIFEETLVWMYIKRNDKISETLDKIFIITANKESNIDGKIIYKRSVLNDLEFEIQVDELENDFWNGYIEEFKWIIGDKEITKEWDILEASLASKIKYTFSSYWDHEIKVILTNSAWETKELKTIVNIPKQLKLLKPLKIFNNEELLENIQYEKNLNEYYINEIGVPTTLKLDARFVKADNLLYTLKKVDWDYNSDWDIDESTKNWIYEINTEWNHTITVYYEFAHRKVSDEVITVKEQIFIEWLKKEAIINFDIIKNSAYVPVVVSFDASKSQVKNENIEKFVWDYGDNITEERDSIVPGHKYSKAWDYKVTLTVVTTSWKKYSTSKKLILKPKPQSAKITTSLKKAETMQWIDFSSEKSEWQIIWYFWDFWDGNISTEANPTHSYKKAWNYKVILRLDYSNKNEEKDDINITIYE